MNPETTHRHRKSIRLKGYDYAQAGLYFGTICTENRTCLFGDVVDDEMVLNQAGQIVMDVWNEIPNHFIDVDVDAFVVMPNHVHGVIVIRDIVGTTHVGATRSPSGARSGCVAPTAEGARAPFDWVDCWFL